MKLQLMTSFIYYRLLGYNKEWHPLPMSVKNKIIVSSDKDSINFINVVVYYIVRARLMKVFFY